MELSSLPDDLLHLIQRAVIKADACDAYDKMRTCLTGPNVVHHIPLSVKTHINLYGTIIHLNTGIRPGAIFPTVWLVELSYGRWYGSIILRYFRILRYLGPEKHDINTCIYCDIEFGRKTVFHGEEWESFAVAWILASLRNRKGVLWHALQDCAVPEESWTQRIVECFSDCAGHVMSHVDNSSVGDALRRCGLTMRGTNERHLLS